MLSDPGDSLSAQSGSTDQLALEAYRRAHHDRADGYGPARHNFLDPDVRLLNHEVMGMFGRAFERLAWGHGETADKRLLEVGCAWGLRLHQLLGFGFRPSHLLGVDLYQPWLGYASQWVPGPALGLMSAARLGLVDRCFDVTCAVMSLSAMLERDVIQRALMEMCRVSREALIVIDNFDPRHEDRRNGALYLRGVDPLLVTSLVEHPRVTAVERLGRFWTCSRRAWRLRHLLARAGLGAIAYGLAIGLLARHSHRAYLVRLSAAS